MIRYLTGALLILAVVVDMSQPLPYGNQQPPQSYPPLIEFKNGGFRVNFAGYHAEAGLGALFGNGNLGGGLHASAGTPFGAHASARLGGNLDGERGGLGGGLHAEAGLGQGRPSARAGLGGMLRAGGMSGSSSGAYGPPPAYPGQSNPNESYGQDAKRKVEHKNIQKITKSGSNSSSDENPKGNSDKNKQMTQRKQSPQRSSETYYATPPADRPSEPHNYYGPGMFGGLYAGATAGGSKGVHKMLFKSKEVPVVNEPPSPPVEGPTIVDAIPGPEIYPGDDAINIIVDNNHRPSRLHQRRLRHRLRKAEKKAATTIILSDDDFSEHEIVSHNDPIVTRTVRESDSKEKAVKSKTKETK